MRVINPVVWSDAMITSSSVAEPAASETAWVSGGTYALNDLRIRSTTHRVYQCVQAHTGIATLPELDATRWLDIGPTLKWAMFDGAVNTQTTNASSLSVVLLPGSIVTGLYLGELVGSSVTITQKTAPGGTVVYSKTINLDGTLIADWYQYFFEPFSQLVSVVLTDLPPYLGCEITVTITGTGTVKCGILSTGQAYSLGSLQYGAAATILDYSSKTTDAYGTTKLVKRPYSKRMTGKLYIETGALNKTHSLLATLRSTPCVWIGVDSDLYANPLVVFGYYKDFSIEITYPTFNVCSLQLEGLV